MLLESYFGVWFWDFDYDSRLGDVELFSMAVPTGLGTGFALVFKQKDEVGAYDGS